jgi:transposase InsO family protein
MRILNGLAPGALRLGKIPLDLSRDAQKRLKWFDYYHLHGNNARLTCRYFGISPQTFYRWKARYNPKVPETLEDRSHRPKRVRRPIWRLDQVEAVLGLRQTYPRWGKDKLAVLLKEQGHALSSSMIGRILRYLRSSGQLKEPKPHYVSQGKRQQQRPYAIRKPRAYQSKNMGDLVQVDTLDLRPLPGVIFKHFTAHDVVSKWNVIEVGHSATATAASRFLDTLKARMPFPVRAVQVDGGSEFEAAFEEACKQQGIQLFILPPRSPKLNGGVERAHRTHTEEFYEVTDSSFDLADIRQQLLQWENIYNTIRPHQSLGYLTPFKFLQKEERSKVSLIT